MKIRLMIRIVLGEDYLMCFRYLYLFVGFLLLEQLNLIYWNISYKNKQCDIIDNIVFIRLL